jgi:HEPN domain-containing protein
LNQPNFYIVTKDEAEEQIQTAKELITYVEQYVSTKYKK